jgi:transposase
LHQDLQTVLRCHMAAFEAMGGAPRTILYDRMKTAVIAHGCCYCIHSHTAAARAKGMAEQE